MITIYNHHLFLLAIAFIFLLILPVINCTSNQIKGTLIENKIGTTPIGKDRLYDILKQEKLNTNNYDEDEEIKYLIREFFKNYPHRRASSFHAMRGKRFIEAA
jgi:hypothetical protein